MHGNMRVQTSMYYGVWQVDHNLRQRSLESGYFKSRCGSMLLVAIFSLQTGFGV